jgi:hypothetical protein
MFLIYLYIGLRPEKARMLETHKHIVDPSKGIESLEPFKPAVTSDLEAGDLCLESCRDL